MESRALLAALQLADGALPIGRFAHSQGLEALLEASPELGDADIYELVESQITESAGPLDGVATVLACAARDGATLDEIDRAVTVRRITPGSRLASTSCGRQLGRLAPHLTDAQPARGYCDLVTRGRADGNLCVVEGTIAAARGISGPIAVLVGIRGTASAMLSAAVRLGRLTAQNAQRLLVELEPAIAAAATEAGSRSLVEMRSTVPELEVYALRHRRADARLFIT